MRTTFNILYYTLFTVITGLVLLLVASFFPFDNWYQVKVVLSGSMEPAIHTGSVIVIKPETTYGVGDIITFGADTKIQVPVTHRIIEVAGSDRLPRYLTKGDANDDPDNGTVRSGEIIGRVWFSLPYVGYVLEFTKTPLGFWSLIIIPMTLIALLEIMSVYRQLTNRRRRSIPVSNV